MSENNLKFENGTLYVYENQEGVEKPENVSITSELEDMICNDGSKTILVDSQDGQYILTDSNTVLLQEGDTNLTQFYINENSESFIIDEDNSSINNLYQSGDCVQLVEEDTNDVQQIIYYTNDDLGAQELAPVHELTEQNNVLGIQDEDGNIYPFKRIRLETQPLNFEEFVHKPEDLVAESQQSNGDDSMEYTIVEDQRQYCTPEQFSTEESNEKSAENEVVDLSKITGRNLITGQTVTLHGYMEKLKKRLDKTTNSISRKSYGRKIYNDHVGKPELNNLLDKKIVIGKSKSGKKIVGKIIHVDRKTVPKNEQDDDKKSQLVDSPLDSNKNEDQIKKMSDVVDMTRITVRKSSVSKEDLEQISKTLGGIMEMETVRKKLENKNIVVKLVEKKYVSESDSFKKSTSYSYGYMETEVEQIGDEEMERWKFVPEEDGQEVLCNGGFVGDDGGVVNRKTARYTITTSLTILITYEKAGNRTIRVNLNPAPGNLCTVCAEYFKSNLQLRQHMNMVHNTFGNNSMCEVCETIFDDPQVLQEHRRQHVQEGKLFSCSDCNKCFISQAKLQKHLPAHDVSLRPLECSVCEVRCASEWALKKHLLTHTGFKPFACDICNKQFMTQYDLNFHKKIHFPEKHFACNVCFRTFSRHSNLLRHTEIHGGTGAMFKCAICFCSYNYISSLTRHIVQNHIE